MRTTTTVNGQASRRAQRLRAERLCLRSRWRLMLCACALRTASTLLLPRAGGDAWWITALCLAPGVALYSLCRLALRLSGRETLGEAAKALLGRGGWRGLRLVLQAALAVEAVSAMTALVTFFTQGVGAAGTQWSMALITAGLMALCLQGDGLARGIRLLRWLLLAALMVWALSGLGHVRIRSGVTFADGDASACTAALRQGLGMGWLMILPLTCPPPGRRGRLRQALPPVVLCVGCVLLVCLMLPPAILRQTEGMAQAMLLTVAFRPGVLQLAGVCLWTATLFLHMAGAVQCLTELSGQGCGAWSMALGGAAALTQLLPVAPLWAWLTAAQPWQLLPLALSAGLVIPAAWRRMRRRRA